MQPAAGQQITGELKLVRPLGRGGMGAVWVAHHLARNCEVAVKLISVDEVAGGLLRASERFSREAETAMRLHDPHVIQTFEHGMTQGGQPYLVMELLEGQSLEERIESIGALSLPDVARLVDQTASALTAAHALGIVHRDIKPDNVFVEAGRPSLYIKVLDFGIAKDTGPSKGSSLTATGLMVGSPYFMAPEQMENAKRVGPAADIFSLGAVAYYALTAKLPFDGDTPVELWNAKKTGDYVPASHRAAHCPADVDAWFARALASDPQERFPTPMAMAIAFSNAVGMGAPRAAANVRSDTQPLPDPEATQFPPQPERFPTPHMPAPPGPAPGPTMADGSVAGGSVGGGTVPIDLDPGGALAGEGEQAAGPRDDRPGPRPPPPKTMLKTTPGAPSVLQAAAGTQIASPHTAVHRPSVPDAPRPSIAQPPPRSRARKPGIGKAIGIGALVALAGAGAAVYLATREPPPLLARCKETQPDKCLRVGTELLDDGEEAEAFRYLAVAALRDSRLFEARLALDKLGEIELETAELAAVEAQCDEGNSLACYLHARMTHAKADTHAVTYLQERCEEKKDVDACAELGAVHDGGHWGVRADVKEGVAYHRAACEGGSARGCVRLGTLLRDGKGGLKKSPKEAVELFDKACDDKEMGGCVELGRAYARALGDLERDLKRAADLFEEACKSSELEGCWELGRALARARGRERDQERAVTLYERACEGGIMSACTQWGVMHEGGNGGLKKDESRAIELYRRACDAEDPSGCVALGVAYQFGLGDAGKDEAKAVALYKRGCDADYLEGCDRLGHAHSDGIGDLEKDRFRAFDMHRRACEGDLLGACVSVGYYHQKGIGGAEKNDELALELWTRACDGGAATGCSNLGAMYARGEGGVAKDEKKAFELFERACEDGFGNLAACANMGTMVEHGSGGVSRDVARAAKIYRDACNRGGQMACVNLGNLYFNGKAPIDRDRARAAGIYSDACKRHHPNGCSRLGWAYEHGYGVDKNEGKAVKLYTQACDAGSGGGCASLALMYERGRGGLPISRDRARELYRQACEAGSSYGCQAAKRL